MKKQQTESHIYGMKAQGRNHLKKHLDGGELTRKEAILAQCYDCMGGYTDGKYGCMVLDCPLYPFMPYRDRTK